LLVVLVAFTSMRGLWPPALDHLAARRIELEDAICFPWRRSRICVRLPSSPSPIVRASASQRAAALALIVAGTMALIGASAYRLHWQSAPIYWGIPCAAIVAGAIFAGDPKEPGRAWRWMLVLGNASYSLYLTHGVVHVAMRTDGALISHPLAEFAPWLYASILVALAIVVALPVFWLVERPMTKGLKRGLLHLHVRDDVRTPSLQDRRPAHRGGIPRVDVA
jgi:peptidoglycan/LPS O-acetylase OafA/YrhL